jgi:hypothetical protein
VRNEIVVTHRVQRGLVRVVQALTAGPCGAVGPQPPLPYDGACCPACAGRGPAGPLPAWRRPSLRAGGWARTRRPSRRGSSPRAVP